LSNDCATLALALFERVEDGAVYGRKLVVQQHLTKQGPHDLNHPTEKALSELSEIQGRRTVVTEEKAVVFRRSERVTFTLEPGTKVRREHNAVLDRAAVSPDLDTQAFIQGDAVDAIPCEGKYLYLGHKRPANYVRD
jgi:hypothetical protein